MDKEEVAPVKAAEEVVEEEVAEGKYGLHVRLDASLQDELRDMAQLAYRLGRIEKATLPEVINLFINYGREVLKRQWLDRMGYR